MSGGRRRHAFKILCPELLVSSIMGPRGAIKDHIQEETGCKLVISNRDEHYPGTRLRILVIYGDEPDRILAALDRVVDHVLDCTEKERANPTHRSIEESDFLGKESSECVLRVAIPDKTSGAIIGPRGSNVQAIRAECQAKVFIEKNHELGHQLLKLIAPADGLRSALVRINQFVQDEARSASFEEWANVRSFGRDETRDRRDDGAERETGRPRDRDRDRSPRPRSRSRDRERDRYGMPARAHGHRDDREWREGPADRDRRGHAEEDRWQGRSGRPDVAAPRESALNTDALVGALAATASSFGKGVFNTEYTITCDMPSAKVSVLIGTKGDHIKGVRRSTGTRIHFEEIPSNGERQQTMLIHGPLLSVYRAHTLMMRKYHDDELEFKHSRSGTGVEGLQEQLAGIQKQLEQVQGGKGKGHGKGYKGW